MNRADSRFRGRGRTLRDAFQELKQRGPQVLVTGDVPRSVSRRATRLLLGHPDEERHRVLALTDSDTAPNQWFPGRCDPDDEDVAFIDAEELDDSAAVDATADASSENDPLVGMIDRELSDWCPSGETPPPAVLRLGVYSVEPLLENHGLEAVTRFLYQLTGDVRRVRGMGHYHLPRGPGSAAVADLQYVFDARLELRLAADVAEQRWHLPGRGTTDWVAFDEY